MQLRLRIWYDALRSNFWFAPLVMAVGGTLAALLLLQADRNLPVAWIIDALGYWVPTSEEARALLRWLLSTVLSTVGVVFALLTLPMSVATGQFGSRLLRGYQRDRTTQFVLGLFVATVFYCAVAIVTIPDAGEMDNLPIITVSGAVLLGLATFGGVIFLISHIGLLLQAPRMIFRAADDLRAAIRDELQPAGEKAVSPQQAEQFSTMVERVLEEGWPVRATETGYIHAVTTGAMLKLAERHDLVIYFLHRAGQYVSEGEVVAMIWPPQRATEEIGARVHSAFLLGEARTVAQDIEYGVSQLVEIGARALSPGINDPYTAITCLQQLGTSLALAAERAGPSPYHVDAAGHLRYVYQPVTFARLVDTAYHMLRRYARESPDVLIALLESIAHVATHSRRAADREHLLAHAKLVFEEVEASTIVASEKRRIGTHFADVRTRILKHADSTSRWHDSWSHVAQD